MSSEPQGFKLTAEHQKELDDLQEVIKGVPYSKTSAFGTVPARVLGKIRSVSFKTTDETNNILEVFKQASKSTANPLTGKVLLTHVARNAVPIFSSLKEHYSKIGAVESKGTGTLLLAGIDKLTNQVQAIRVFNKEPRAKHPLVLPENKTLFETQGDRAEKAGDLKYLKLEETPWVHVFDSEEIGPYQAVISKIFSELAGDTGINWNMGELALYEGADGKKRIGLLDPGDATVADEEQIKTAEQKVSGKSRDLDLPEPFQY